MNKFKEGDKVRVVSGCTWYEYGENYTISKDEVYTVRNPRINSTCISLKEFNSTHQAFAEVRFEKMDVRGGDTVLVEMKVLRTATDNTGKKYVYVGDGQVDIRVDCERVKEVINQPLRVGDIVKRGARVWHIKAIVDDQAMLYHSFGNDKYWQTAPVAELKR